MAAAPHTALNAVPHVCAERVRWADVDLVGIMRFSAFTRLVEHAEQEWMRTAGLPFDKLFTEPEVWMPRRQLTIDYFSPARLDDALAMITYVPRVGETSYTFNVDIVALDDGTPRASAAVVLVCVDNASFTKRPLPQHFRNAITPFQLDRDAALRAAVPLRRDLLSLSTAS